MKKLILCSAIALAMSTSGAFAKSHTVGITLDGRCDIFSVTVQGENVGLLSTNPQCDLGIGSGYISKVKKYGRYAVLGAILNYDVTVHYVIGLQYPFVTGGSFTVAYTSDGVHLHKNASSGTYTVSGTAAHGPRGGASLTSTLRK